MIRSCWKVRVIVLKGELEQFKGRYSYLKEVFSHFIWGFFERKEIAPMQSNYFIYEQLFKWDWSGSRGSKQEVAEVISFTSGGKR